MVKKQSTAKPYITELPLTAEAREKYIEQLFHEEMPNQGAVFVPDDNFYLGKTIEEQAMHMTKSLCKWLGIKPGFVGLEFENLSTSSSENSKYNIFVENKYTSDEMLLGAFLALTLVKHLIEDLKQVILSDSQQRASMIASASVEFGLGLVVENGIRQTNYLFGKSKNIDFDLMKGFPVANYSHMTQKYLQKYRIDQKRYLHSLTYLTAKRLGMPKTNIMTYAVRDFKHKANITKLKFVGLVWIVLLILGIGGFLIFQRVKPTDSRISTASQDVNFYKTLLDKCENQYSYEKQYSDSTDLQSQRVLSTTYLRCLSLQKQYESAQRKYNELTK